MMLLGPRTAWISPAALLLTGAILPLDGTAQNQMPPRMANQRGLNQSVVLRGGGYGPTMQQLHVLRQYPMAAVRANPQIVSGETRFDFTPVLNNPKALINVGQRLHAMPQQVEVKEETAEVNEIDQGLVIHQVLSYRILPGKCADAASKDAMARAGISCFTRAPMEQRIAAFSNPADPHYVADPGKRQAAIAAFQKNSALEDAESTKQIAQLRQALADPAKRAAITQQVGADEAARMQAMNDVQLRDEVINTAVQRIEDVEFVPRIPTANYAHPRTSLRIEPGGAELAAGQGLLRGGGSSPQFPKLLRVIPGNAYRSLGNSNGPGGDQVSDLDLGTYIYLTGFTLGHDYEWSREVDVTVNWCIVGCSDTYSLKVWAGFNYGFGLRFPIQTQLKYHNVVHANNSAQATMTATYEPIQGTAQDFASTGLASDQIFDGKELVAQVGADAGFSVNLPILSGNNQISVGIDFTDYLPSPYKGGHFTPPAPGTGGINSPFILDQLDLLGGLLNFGVVGGQVFPAVNINLHSNKLQFTVNDEITHRATLVAATNQPVNLGVNNTSIHDSHFSFGGPVYNLGFTLTPGIDARLFVDIAVWSDHWDWPIWFPQLSVDLPPGGKDFTCHAGTTCFLDFQPEHQAAITGGIDQELAALKCQHEGNTMVCPTYKGYLACQNALRSHPLGWQSCNPGMAVKQGEAADQMLMRGQCQHNGGGIGNYFCPMQSGMLGLCNTFLNNGAVLSCQVLVPPSTDQILKRGGCRENPGPPGNYVCPKGMFGLCQLYVKNKVILGCTQGN